MKGKGELVLLSKICRHDGVYKFPFFFWGASMWLNDFRVMLFEQNKNYGLIA